MNTDETKNTQPTVIPVESPAPESAPTVPAIPAEVEEVAQFETEPATGSGVPVAEPVAPEQATVDAAPQPYAETPVGSPAVVVATEAAVPKKRLSKKRVIAFAALGAVLVVGGGVAAFALTYRPPVELTETAKVVTPVAKMGVAVTVADGTVSYRNTATGDWQAATTDTQLKEGASVRAAADGRAVLTFDDGSALRLDGDSAVTLTSLDASDIRVAQDSGVVYSRVVPSDRSYAVTIGDTNYKAMGTAFSTIHTSTETGVRVFQSSVRVTDVDGAVTEGKQYFEANPDAKVKQVVSDIDLNAMADDEFLRWNLSEDEKSSTFADKMGVLKDVKTKVSEKEEAAKRQAAEEAAATAAATAKKSAEKTESTNTVTSGALTLSVSASGEASWAFTGSAPYGFKLVASKSHSPTYPGSSYNYYSDSDTRSGTVPAKEGKGTYYVRVCVYTNGTEEEACKNYSNEVEYVKK